MNGIRGRGVSVASRNSTRASKHPVTQLVCAACGVFPLSTPCVSALRGFVPGRVFPDRTTRRHDLARLPPNWVGLAGRFVTAPTTAPMTTPRLVPSSRPVIDCSAGTSFSLVRSLVAC